MYQAKGNGRDTIAYSHPRLEAEADARLALEEDLRTDLEGNNCYSNTRRRWTISNDRWQWKPCSAGSIPPAAGSCAPR